MFFLFMIQCDISITCFVINISLQDEKSREGGTQEWQIEKEQQKNDC